MKKSTWNKIDWKIALDKVQRPFLYIRPSLHRYSVSQDGK